MTIKGRFKVISKQLILLVLGLLLLVTGNLVPQAAGFLFYFYCGRAECPQQGAVCSKGSTPLEPEGLLLFLLLVPQPFVVVVVSLFKISGLLWCSVWFKHFVCTIYFFGDELLF